jgi:hypothetical protein
VGDLDSFGVEFDHLLIVRRLGGASVDSVFHPPHPVVDLAFVQWDADASQEIALMYADGVDVFDSDGAQFATPLASFQLGGAISMCAVAPAAGTPNGGGRIAALHVLGGVKSLSTLSPVGPSMSTLALPSTLNYFRIASGDADADGDGDLVFTDGRVYGPFYLRNDSPNDPWFAAPESWTAQLITEHPVLLDVSASNNQARPVFADLTGDGRADLLLALQRTTNNAGDPQPAHLFLEAQAGGQSFVPTLPPALFRGGFQSGLLPANLRTAVLRIDLAQITPLGNTINGVEVTVWRQPYFGATIDTGFVYRAVHPLVTPSPANTIGVAVDFVDPAVCFTNLYWVQVMPVSYSGSPTNLNVTNIGHPFFGALAMDEDAVCGDLTANGEKPYWITGGNNTALTNLPGMSGCYDYDSCGVYFGTAPAGAVVGRRRLPPLSPNTMSNDANAPHVRALEDHTLSY